MSLVPKSSFPARKLGTISSTCEETGARRDSTWQSHTQSRGLRVPFRSPQTSGCHEFPRARPVERLWSL